LLSPQDECETSGRPVRSRDGWFVLCLFASVTPATRLEAHLLLTLDLHDGPIVDDDFHASEADAAGGFRDPIQGRCTGLKTRVLGPVASLRHSD
jgi:hypothetical protein